MHQEGKSGAFLYLNPNYTHTSSFGHTDPVTKLRNSATTNAARLNYFRIPLPSFKVEARRVITTNTGRTSHSFPDNKLQAFVSKRSQPYSKVK